MQHEPNKNKRTVSGISLLAAAIALTVLVSTVFALAQFRSPKSEESAAESSAPAPQQDESSQEQSTPDVHEPGKDTYYSKLILEETAFSNSDVVNGSLAVITGSGDKFPTIDETKKAAISRLKTGNVYGLSTTALVDYESAIKAVDSFLVAFDAQSVKNSGLIINRAYTRPDTIGSHPEFADLTTGYSVELALYNTNNKFTDEGFKFLPEQCYKYGIIQRYPEGKEAHTSVAPSATIYRYVGLAHSWYMNYYNLCLEEYMDKLRTERLIEYKSELESNVEYIIYYVEANGSGNTTNIPIPSNANYTYEVSGDGSSGFIVTVRYPLA